MRERIFEKGVRLNWEINEDTGKPYNDIHQTGTGYGLHIVKEAVKRYGGSCSAMSLPEPVFDYSLPFLQACLTEAAKKYYSKNVNEKFIQELDRALQDSKKIDKNGISIYERVIHEDVYPVTNFFDDESWMSGMTFGDLFDMAKDKLHETVFTMEIPASIYNKKGVDGICLKLGIN